MGMLSDANSVLIFLLVYFLPPLIFDYDSDKMIILQQTTKGEYSSPIVHLVKYAENILSKELRNL